MAELEYEPSCFWSRDNIWKTLGLPQCSPFLTQTCAFSVSGSQSYGLAESSLRPIGSLSPLPLNLASIPTGSANNPFYSRDLATLLPMQQDQGLGLSTFRAHFPPVAPQFQLLLLGPRLCMVLPSGGYRWPLTTLSDEWIPAIGWGWSTVSF